MARGYTRDGRETSFNMFTKGLDKHFENLRRGRMKHVPLETRPLKEQIRITDEKIRKKNEEKEKEIEMKKERIRFTQDCPHFKK